MMRADRRVALGWRRAVLGPVAILLLLVALHRVVVLLSGDDSDWAARNEERQTATAEARAALAEERRAAGTATAAARVAAATATVETKLARDQRLTERLREEARLNFASPAGYQTSWWPFIDDLRVDGDRAVVVIAPDRDGVAMTRQQLVNLCLALSHLTTGPDWAPDRVTRLVVRTPTGAVLLARDGLADRCDRG